MLSRDFYEEVHNLDIWEIKYQTTLCNPELQHKCVWPTGLNIFLLLGVSFFEILSARYLFDGPSFLHKWATLPERPGDQMEGRSDL